MDIFARFPPELRLMVLKYAPNLASLHSLVRASPHPACTFDGFNAEIIESVTTSSMAYENQMILRTIAAIRTDSLRCRTLDDFLESYVRSDAANEQPFAKPISPSVGRGLLETAYKIRCLTTCCVQGLMDGLLTLDEGFHKYDHRRCISRALWRIELYFELKKLGIAERFPFPTEDLPRLRNISRFEFWGHLPEEEVEKIQGVYDFLRRTRRI